MKPQEFDLIIMGGGLAGPSAGVRACELGMVVALVEKGETDQYPCNSRFSGGVLHLAFQNVKDPPDQLAKAVEEATGNHHLLLNKSLGIWSSVTQAGEVQ